MNRIMEYSFDDLFVPRKYIVSFFYFFIILIKYYWFVCVLWLTNPLALFNAKSCLYTVSQMQFIYMIMIYYRDKCNDSHLNTSYKNASFVLEISNQWGFFCNCYNIRFLDMQCFFEFFSLGNESLSY